MTHGIMNGDRKISHSMTISWLNMYFLHSIFALFSETEMHHEPKQDKLCDEHTRASVLRGIPRYPPNSLWRHPVDLITVLLPDDTFLVYGRTDLGGECLYSLNIDNGEVIEHEIRGETPYQYFDQGLVLQIGAGSDTFHVIGSNGLHWTICRTVTGSYLFIKSENMSINMTIPHNVRVATVVYFAPENEELVIARQWIRGVFEEKHGFTEYYRGVEHPVSEINHIFASNDDRLFCTGAALPSC